MANTSGLRSGQRGAARVKRALAGTVAVLGAAVAAALLALGGIIVWLGDSLVADAFGGVMLSGGIGFGVLAGFAGWSTRRARTGAHLTANDRVVRKRTPERLRDGRDLPADTREEWRRLLRARAVVADLAASGLIGSAEFQAIDERVADLRAALVNAQRTEAAGARHHTALRARVRDLADQVVAVASDGVSLQGGAVDSGEDAVRTARERLRHLREARAEVDRLGGRQEG